MLWIALMATCAMAQVRGTATNPEAGAHLPAQAAADAIREVAQTDGAFIAARSVSGTHDPNNLASMLQFPTDDIVVVKLTGRELRSAFERSISLYPQPNSSFLQLAGFVVEFSAAGAPESRVMNVTVNGSALDENRTYTVAMPGSLGRGGMGYFKIWDKSKIERTVDGATLESVLKGRKYAASSPRWVARP
jgi:2',3'-cyclic-nucleotide 2'-phosphodiesterase (5'-nucleotidase family)